MAARFRIIVLTQGNDAGRTSFQLALWYDVPASRQPFYANPIAKSQWLGAIAGDTAALQNGSVVEEIVTYVPDGLQNIATVTAGAAALWTARNILFQNTNPWARNGTTWDGTTWVLNAVN